MNRLEILGELTQVVSDQASQAKGQVRVAHLPSIIPRNDGNGLFEEGYQFAGTIQRDNASTVLTLVASAHLLERVRAGEIVDALSLQTSQSVTLPAGLGRDDYLSPQLIVWWRDTGPSTSSRMDMPRLASAPPEVQRQFSAAIGEQVDRAYHVIQKVTGRSPVVWGSWGHATLEERAESGRNRGIPTNGHGHMHVTSFDYVTERAGTRKVPSPSEQVNHYRPWTTLVHRRHGEFVAQLIQQPGTTVQPFEETIVAADDWLAGMNVGYRVRFGQPRTFVEANSALLGVVETLSTAHRMLDTFHRHYHCAIPRSQEQDAARLQLLQLLQSRDMPAAEAERCADLVLSIRPTYQQLLSWHASSDNPATRDVLQDQIDRYNQLRHRLAQRFQDRPSVVGTIMMGALGSSNDAQAGAVLHEHQSGTYIWDTAYKDGGLVFNGYSLYPSLESTQSAPEILAGRMQQRVE